MTQKVTYLAGRPGECCTKGSLHSGDPRGQFEELAGFKTYLSKPAEGTANGNVVFYFADVFGFFNNAFLVMDAFADAGYLTLGIDYFHGDSIPKHKGEEGFDFQEWIDKYVAVADEGVPRWVTAVKDKYGKAETKYACVGYCFGGPYVLGQLASGGSCSTGATVHPGLLTDAHFENLEKPLFISAPSIDDVFPTEARRTAQDILLKKEKIFHLQEFPGVDHGYGLRCNMDIPYERWVKEHCFMTIVDWFKFWLEQN